MPIKICACCGEQFVSRSAPQKYCSPKCQRKDYQTKKKLEIYRRNFNNVEYTCRWCGKQFKSGTPVEFCSDICRKAHRKKEKVKSKENAKEIARINQLARDEGLTYGQYFKKYGY